jgi:hypothetical protein
MPACLLESWKKNFNLRWFFSWFFFVVRANQKIRILALGRRSKSDDIDGVNLSQKKREQAQL